MGRSVWRECLDENPAAGWTLAKGGSLWDAHTGSLTMISGFFHSEDRCCLCVINSPVWVPTCSETHVGGSACRNMWPYLLYLRIMRDKWHLTASLPSSTSKKMNSEFCFPLSLIFPALSLNALSLFAVYPGPLPSCSSQPRDRDSCRAAWFAPMVLHSLSLSVTVDRQKLPS